MTEKKADLVLKNGSIYTVDGKGGWAQALAVSGWQDRLCWIGCRCSSVY